MQLGAGRWRVETKIVDDSHASRFSASTFLTEYLGGLGSLSPRATLDLTAPLNPSVELIGTPSDSWSTWRELHVTTILAVTQPISTIEINRILAVAYRRAGAQDVNLDDLVSMLEEGRGPWTRAVAFNILVRWGSVWTHATQLPARGGNVAAMSPETSEFTDATMLGSATHPNRRDNQPAPPRPPPVPDRENPVPPGPDGTPGGTPASSRFRVPVIVGSSLLALAGIGVIAVKVSRGRGAADDVDEREPR